MPAVTRSTHFLVCLENVEPCYVCPDYYQVRSVSFLQWESDELFQKYNARPHNARATQYAIYSRNVPGGHDH